MYPPTVEPKYYPKFPKVCRIGGYYTKPNIYLQGNSIETSRITA